ncbi:TIGR03986 family CRISPR-associated RAMP protein [Clostridium perfringens]|nr:TIGR03986 family CRISPR-associated RAMP protein [Clostridium perfringens]
MDFREKPLSDHSVAPYNFVRLPKVAITAYENLEELPKHNEMNDELLNGNIEFEIVAKTPIIVAKNSENENKTFFKNVNGENTIPGNTIRGLVRTNAAILSRSNISEDIEDSRFFFRSFGKDVTQQEYRKRLDIGMIKENGASYSIAKNVNAGFIYLRGKDDYVIVPAKKIQGEGYFRISEQFLRNIAGNIDGINYMYTKEISNLITNREKFKKDNREKSFFLKRIINRSYKPYYKKISFDLKDKRTIGRIGEVGVFRNNGYIISSSYIQGKLGHYVIAEGDFNSSDIIELNGEKLKHIQFYNDDYIRTKKNDDFFKLPTKVGKENGKPIFYGEFKDNLYMGFTPYFRIPYDNNLKSGIKDEYKNSSGFSFVDALFGFTNKGEEKLSYKGRISFEDFIYSGEENEKTNIISKKYYDVVLGEPKASCFQNYLVQGADSNPKDLNTFNSKDFRISGIKQYWQKNYIDAKASGKQNVDVRLNPLKTGSKFKGKINFTNLKKEELGLLLWAIKVDDKATENIGLGKPYGFGRVEFRKLKVNLEDLKEKYSSMTMNFTKEINGYEYKEEYKKFFKNKYKVSLDKDISVKELITIKTTLLEEKDYNEGRYMNLGKEFAQKLPLLSIENQIKLIKK